ncbi:MAG: hypothetical protein ACJA1A_001630 [Saprospiraceae bacterium]|jgi:hypothetical protein|tara:strand:- start:215 stop:682 length:468 start_codon:yes stop_codon:yes gene_type:complete
MTNIDSTFKIIHSIRKTIAFTLSRLTLEQINNVPDGQSNNIIWNATHLIAVQQLLVNRRSDAPYTEGKDITAYYKPGTKPDGDVTKEFVDYIRERLVGASVQMEEDYKAGLFDNYEPFETRTRVKLENAVDAINFVLFHEGIHLGYIMSYINLIK